MKATFLDNLRLLARGIDPHTTEPFPPDSVIHKPEVIRSLFALIEELSVRLNEPKKSTRRRGSHRNLDALRERNVSEGRTPRSHFPWTNEEELELARLFREGAEILAIAEYFERTRAAIIAKLQTLALISREEALLLNQADTLPGDRELGE